MRCPDCAVEVNPLREYCHNCGSPTDITHDGQKVLVLYFDPRGTIGVFDRVAGKRYPLLQHREYSVYRAHLSPRRLAATLATKAGQRKGVAGGEPTDHAKRLVGAIHAVLNQAIKAGGSSLRDHRQTSGELGYFQHSFQVYDREGEKCQTAGCGGIVRRFTQNGRSTFWCPKCQK